MSGIDVARYKRIVQYFWDPEPRNEEGPGSRMWCLGNEYVTPDDDSNKATGPDCTPDIASAPLTTEELPTVCDNPRKSDSTSTSSTTKSTTDHGWPSAFLDDFESRIWITYRSNFPLIPKSKDPNAQANMSIGVRLRSQLVETEGFTSDTGWGCMIRSGQSLLANALSILLLGREWRRGSKIAEESRLLGLFADHPDAPFSIHRFVNYGASSCGKYPGEWFGPSATARCIQALSSDCHDTTGLNVYVTSDSSDVYEDRFRQIASNGSDGIQPTLILLGIRLGIDRVTPVYRPSLAAALKMPQSVGIAGGRPAQSHYFIGVQNEHFFYLDPHHTRPALPRRNDGELYTQDELDSYHTRRLRRLNVDDMDPSMLIGFLIMNEADWQDWKERVRSSPGKPIVHIFPHEPTLSPGHEREAALEEVEALDDDDF